MSSHKLKDGIFVRNLKHPVLKLENLSSKVQVFDESNPQNTQMGGQDVQPTDLEMAQLSNRSNGKSLYENLIGNRKKNQLWAAEQFNINKTINVFGNNQSKTLTQRIKDLNYLHHDLSPTNMVAFAQLPEQRFCQVKRDDPHSDPFSQTHKTTNRRFAGPDDVFKNNNIFKN